MEQKKKRKKEGNAILFQTHSYTHKSKHTQNWKTPELKSKINKRLAKRNNIPNKKKTNSHVFFSCYAINALLTGKTKQMANSFSYFAIVEKNSLEIVIVIVNQNDEENTEWFRPHINQQCIEIFK